MSARILQGDVFSQLPTIKPRSVDCVVTSPPYWMLRSYLPKGNLLKRFELGLEKTPQEYIANMVRVFQLVRETMADHATCWINVGDTYADDSKYGGATGGKHVKALHGQTGINREKKESGIDAGNLCLIPQRLMIALQDDGWIVRSVVIWHKPAPMPSSVSGWAWKRCRIRDPKFTHTQYGGKGAELDRQSASERIKQNVATSRANGMPHDSATVGHLGWIDCPGCKKCRPAGGYVLRKGSWRPTSAYEPIIMLAKTADYFCDGESVKTPSNGHRGSSFVDQRDFDVYENLGTDARAEVSSANLRDVWRVPLEDMSKEDLIGFIQSMDDGHLPDVWRIAAEPLKDAHYAAFPTELARKCLQAGTSAKGYCPACGKPWVRVIESKSVPHPSPRKNVTNRQGAIDTKGGNQANGSASTSPEVNTIGWRPSCSCPKDEPRPALVLDPFAGSGRTGQAAQWLGLDFVGVELNPVYVEMAERILREDAPLFA
jgi:DNA modification methylase